MPETDDTKEYASGIVLSCYPGERAAIFAVMKKHDLKTPFDAIRLAFSKSGILPKGHKMQEVRKRE